MGKRKNGNGKVTKILSGKQKGNRARNSRNKGRQNEFWMRMLIALYMKIDPSFVLLRSKSANGCDVWTVGDAIKKFPFCVEAKANKRLNIFDAFTQASYNTYKGYLPLVLAKKDNEGHSSKYADHIAALRMIDFFVIMHILNECCSDWYDRFEEIKEKFVDMMIPFSNAKEKYTKDDVESRWTFWWGDTDVEDKEAT